MALETGLRTLLLAQAGITALVPSQSVNGSTVPCVFIGHPRRKVLRPFILIKQAKLEPYVCLDGTLATGSYEIDIECHADEVGDAIDIAKAVSDFLKDYSGPAGSNCTIEAVIWNGKRTDFIEEDAGRDVQIHGCVLSFQIQAR